jgi:hypothetical protein
MTLGRRISRIMVSVVLGHEGAMLTMGSLESRTLDVVQKGISTLPMVVAKAVITSSRMKSPKIPYMRLCH